MRHEEQLIPSLSRKETNLRKRRLNKKDRQAAREQTKERE